MLTRILTKAIAFRFHSEYCIPVPQRILHSGSTANIAFRFQSEYCNSRKDKVHSFKKCEDFLEEMLGGLDSCKNYHIMADTFPYNAISSKELLAIISNAQ